MSDRALSPRGGRRRGATEIRAKGTTVWDLVDFDEQGRTVVDLVPFVSGER